MKLSVNKSLTLLLRNESPKEKEAKVENAKMFKTKAEYKSGNFLLLLF